MTLRQRFDRARLGISQARARINLRAREAATGASKALVSAGPDLVGFAAYLLVVSGVWELAGGAWARVLAGAPIAAIYFWLGLRPWLRRAA